MVCPDDENPVAFLRKRMKKLILGIAAVVGLSLPSVAGAARLKDIADVEGVRANQLLGYGLVVGLNGTGDGRVDFTLKTMSNMLERMGIRTDPQLIKVKNVAAVSITAELPSFARPGTRIPITVSSMGDAKSLFGGILLYTQLKAGDGNTYAVAQGPIDLGGFAVNDSGDSAQKNHPTVGTVPGGATVERAISFDLFQSNKVRVVLRNADFTTMTHVVSALNRRMGRPAAVAIDSGVAEVELDETAKKNPVALVASLEQLEVRQDIDARVVINERTGTIIMGANVTVGQVALAHGNLNVSIRRENDISQPNAFAGGTTAEVTNVDINVGEDVEALRIVGGDVTLGQLVKVLNTLGATPRDLMAIFTALQQAGALNAELVVM
jgi:flagellar P-ring protein precursor FlgI